MLYWIDLGTNECIELCFWDGKILGTTLGAPDVFLLGTHDGEELGWLSGSTDGVAYGKLEGLLLGA